MTQPRQQTRRPPQAPPLSTRELNRATLARQLLLGREHRDRRDAAEVVEHLVGLHSQLPGNPYTALWSRIEGFDPEEFSRRIERRELVRISLQRSTLHTVTARDCLALRPVLQAAQERLLTPAFGRRLAGAEPVEVAARARELVEERPLTFHELGALLAAQWPGGDPQALATVARQLLPLVQVPPRGLWRRGGAARHTTAESWLGTGPAADSAPDASDASDAPDALVLRYLAAFGPASVKDAQTWSGLTRLTEVFRRLRPRLVVLRAEDGTELYDLPDAPRPGADAPAPARFLPDYDNLLVGHADRTRVVGAAARAAVWTGNAARPAFLTDGFVGGTWRLETDTRRARATLLLRPLGPLPRAARAALEEEGAALLAFRVPGADHELTWEAPWYG
ncbi:winged helix DNA-binding domain-containing protein [Streptomyces sp. TRM 70361]|uniref:winged helix DNA-binding domain-containing protein n=1 Tax=Streptomyces sp. TRM 70361 TaxID=3116553 RepID=UPI002E7C1785|nr:winged helix DNA-binding domain-containing protein [Streptomyces sp. TRM 70361]MEE1941036.1 winged helix DNA-binding domain-containing protein [Streptomyces sp. TRM 70361]